MPPAFVLTMIVKNEGAIIGRCLDAALPHCAGYVIEDTGSTDNTVEEIQAAAARHNVPGLVWQSEWKNFGENRTLSADRARGWVLDQKLPPTETYLLMIDADMVLVVRDGFDRRALTDHSYSIVQKQPGLDYSNTRLHRADLPWKSHGVTHEYWSCNPYHLGGSVLDVEQIYIDDRNDGGAKADKFERDERLLRGGLEAEPNNARYMFYLAQTLADLGKYREAIEWYDKRSQIYDHPDEPWYCGFRKGQCLLHLGEPAAADVLLRTYNARPNRAEPLYYLARHYREAGQNHAALMLTEQAATIPYPAGAFFVEPGIYTGRMLKEEMAINAWHAGKYALGMAATEDLIRQRDQYPGFYAQMSQHASFYATPIAHHSAGRIAVPEGIRRGYSASSPALTQYRGEWYIHSRLVNYYHEKGWVFQSRDPDGIIRTRGARAKWTPEAGASDWLELDAALPPHFPSGDRVLGAEDQRWAVHQDRVYVTANTWQSPLRAGTPQMLLGRLDEALTRVEEWWPLASPIGHSVEKNWLLWPRDGELFLVYGYDPFTILHWNPETEAVQVAGKWPSPWAAHRFRGSAGPVSHPEKLGHTLVLVHEKAETPVDHIYMQRLLELDTLLRPVALSVPFYIDHRGTEFPLGFADYQGRALITYGREECESAWALIEWDELLKKFQY